MTVNSARIKRERVTMEAMIHLHCRLHHGKRGTLCPECEELIQYARTRLDRCHFKENKPTCAKCPVHCYRADRREQIRKVMRSAGPHMLWRHPFLTMAHWWDGLVHPKINS